MNIHVKILNKILYLQTEFKNTSKALPTIMKLAPFQRYKDDSIYVSQWTQMIK